MTHFADVAQLTPDRLAALVAVSDRGGFGAAAAALGVSQPAVSRQIALLEAVLGVRLFERGGAGVRATNAGRALLAEARRVLGALRRAKEAAAEFAEGRSGGRLRVGASTTPGLYLLPPLIGALRRRDPKLEVEYQVANTERIAELVVQGSIDVGFVGGVVSSDEIIRTRVCDDRIVPVVSTSAPLARLRRVAPRSLAEGVLVLREPGSSTRRLAVEWLASAGASVGRFIQLSCPEAVKALVAGGLGAGFISTLALRGVGGRRGVAVVRTDGPPIRRPVLALRHVDKRETPAMAALVELARGVGRG